MSAEDFQLIDDSKIDDSIIKRDFIKIYHQSGANVDAENSQIKFYFGENHNFIQVGNGYLEFDIRIRTAAGRNFSIDANPDPPGVDIIRLVNNAFAYTIHDARISSSAGVEIEQNKYVGPISTIMRLVTQKEGDLSTYFDIIDESEGEMNNTTLKKILIDNHTEANRGLIRGHLPLEYIFGFCRSFKKITKGLGFELDLRTSNRKEGILYTTLGDNDVNVTINSISLFIPQIIPSPETQVIFNEAISQTFTLSYESWTTDRKPVDTAREFQVDISSASNINSPLYLIAAHQKTQRPDPANPANNLPNNRFNNSIFDGVEVRKYYSEIDGVRYPKNPVMVNFAENNYLEQYRDLKFFYKEYVGEPMLNPIISYDKMKKYYPIQIIDLRFQVDHISPKKIRLFEEYENNPVNTDLYVILIKHREIKMISDGNKIISVEVV